MKNTSYHNDRICQLVTPLLIRGNHMGEMPKIDWLIGWLSMPYWPIHILVYSILALLSEMKCVALCHEKVWGLDV
jgi:hypothetical protein